MNELIKIESNQVGEGTIQTVNARDLHAFLGVGKDFSNWIKKQIERARLIEGRDYATITARPSGRVEGNQGVRIEYYLALDAAKHIAMMSGCEKGFEVRDYFIECERIAKQPAAPLNLNDPAFLRQTLLAYTEKVIALEATVAEQQPKVEALDRISTADGLMCITDAAKTLGVRPKDLFAWMSAKQWIYRRAGNGSWIAYQNRLQQGVLEHKIGTVRYSDGSEQMRERVMVTAKGLARLSEAFAAVAA